MAMVKFDVTTEEMKVISEIANRAVRMTLVQYTQLDVEMDITACHANGNPLRLRELLEADNFNFIHDVAGIRRHLDRTTGKLTGFFSPRYSARS